MATSGSAALVPLRYPRVWLALGWLLVAGVCVGSLLPGTRPPTFLIQDKLVHAASYCVLMIWFAGVYDRNRHVAIALVLLALGFGLDLLQSGVATRSFDVLDVVANGLGILVGLVLARLVLAGWCQRIERLLLA